VNWRTHKDLTTRDVLMRRVVNVRDERGLEEDGIGGELPVL
jgi:hypothetical protein